MVEKLQSLREPAAWLVSALTLVQCLLAPVRLLAYLDSAHMEVPQASLMASYAVADPILPVLVVATAVACILPVPSRGVRPILLVGALAVSLQAIIFAVLRGVALKQVQVQGPTGFLAELLGSVVMAVLLVFLAVVLWMVHGAAGRVNQPVAPVADPYGRPSPAVPSGETLQPPAWSADQASGASWTRAGDAASGAAASGWGRPGESSHGWQPAAPSLPAQAPMGQLPAGPGQGTAPVRASWPTAGQQAAGQTQWQPAADPSDGGQTHSQPRSQGDGMPQWRPAGASDEGC